MLRFLTYIFGAKDYEPCRSCETLKQQLTIANEEKKDLTKTLLGLLKPEVIQAPPVILQPATQVAGVWSKRRAALEERDRQEAKILKERQFVAAPDKSIDKLEEELGVKETA